MIQIFKKRKIQIILILCLSCLLLGLSSVKLSVFAKEKSPYYIKVNKLQNCVTVYQMDDNGEYTIPVKAMACSSGTATPLGIYNTKVKYRWRLLMGDVWGQYSTRIEKGVLFHSVWYYKMDASTLSGKQYNKLGTTASHGCIRLTVADAKWIYDNCAVGTTVEIYNNKNVGPLGKPGTLTVPAGMGWDPTDPSDMNPYKNSNPTITGASNKVIPWGTKMNLLKGIKATSTTGADISSEMEVKGKVDAYTAGKYQITYSIKDASGKSAEKTITVAVKECTEEPVIKGVKDQIVNGNTVVDRKFALKGIKAYLSNVKLANKDIEVNIVKNDTENSYSIKYVATAYNKLIGTATANVYVDATAPVITGVSHREITLDQLSAGKDSIQKMALQGVSVTDDYSDINTDNLTVIVQPIADYAYLVTYKVTDDVGNTSRESVQFTYFANARIDGVMNRIHIPYGTEVTKEYVMQGVTASIGQINCTDKMTVDIKAETENEYMVTYTIQDENNIPLSVISYVTVATAPQTDVNANSDATDNTKEESTSTDSSQTKN